MKSLLLLDLNGKAFSKTEKFLYFLIGALIVSFFLPDMPVIGNIVIGAIVFVSLFYNSWSEKAAFLKQRKEISLMLIFFLFHIVSALISVNRQEGLEMLVLRLPLLIFPLSIGLLYIREDLQNRILTLFCRITTLMALICLIYSIGRSVRLNESAFMYDDSLTELISRQSVYIAQVINVALFCNVYLFFKRRQDAGEVGGTGKAGNTGRSANTGKSGKSGGAWLFYINIGFLFIFHFMLASRIAIITLYASVLLFSVWYMIKMKKVRQGAIWIVCLLVVAFSLVKVFPKTINRFRELKYPGYSFTHHGVESHYNMKVTADQWNGANIRLAVWKCGWELGRHNWLTGVPLGDKEDRLVAVFKDRQFDFAAASRRNMHNTYLDVFCNLGLFGLGIFLLGYLVIPMLGAIRSGKPVNFFIVFSFGGAMITETWLDSSFGCILLAFFICLLSAQTVGKPARI